MFFFSFLQQDVLTIGCKCLITFLYRQYMRKERDNRNLILRFAGRGRLCDRGDFFFHNQIMFLLVIIIIVVL